MTTNTSWPIQRHIKSKIPEPYPFVGAPLEGHLIMYMTVRRSKAGDVPLFAFDSGSTGTIGLIEVHPNGTVVPKITDSSPVTFTKLSADAPRRAPKAPPVPLLQTTLQPDSPVLRTARGLAARHAAVAGNERAVKEFMTDVLGLWHGAGWQEPVSTALLGDWVGSLHTDGRVGHGGLERLKAEARELHRHLTPLWQRKNNGNRLWSLDFDLGDGLTVYDLVTGSPDPHETLAGALPDDPRMAAVLARLVPAERAVAMVWANSQTTNWTEAAAHVMALDGLGGFAAEALGERVRRKLKRLGRQHTERAAAADAREREEA